MWHRLTRSPAVDIDRDLARPPLPWVPMWIRSGGSAGGRNIASWLPDAAPAIDGVIARVGRGRGWWGRLLRVGLVLDGYRDAVMIGEGGLGRVYRAVKVSTGGVVAIKELQEVPSASPAWHRARREVDAMLRLKGHPFVVSVEEIVDGPSGPCLVMEFVEGGSLMDRLVRGPLPIPEVLLIGLQVSQALDDAHALGIIHRDIKPHNLLVGSFGQIKVADFGIAALAREGGLHTRTRSFTLAYASPEELDGEVEIGPPADTYSMGASLCHVATGQRPSVRGDAMIRAVDRLGADSTHLRDLFEVWRRCLEIDPAERPSMSDLHGAFGEAINRLGSQAVSRLATRPIIDHRDVDAAADDATVLRQRTPGSTPSILDTELIGGETTVVRPWGPPGAPAEDVEVVYEVSSWAASRRRRLFVLLGESGVEFSVERRNLVVPRAIEQFVDSVVDLFDRVHAVGRPRTGRDGTEIIYGVDASIGVTDAAALLARLEIPHRWELDQLVVDKRFEDVVDHVIRHLESYPGGLVE